MFLKQSIFICVSSLKKDLLVSIEFRNIFNNLLNFEQSFPAKSRNEYLDKGVHDFLKVQHSSLLIYFSSKFVMCAPLLRYTIVFAQCFAIKIVFAYKITESGVSTIE